MLAFTDSNGIPGTITFYPDRNPVVTVQTPVRTHNIMRARIVGNGPSVDIPVGDPQLVVDFALRMDLVTDITTRNRHITFNYDPAIAVLGHLNVPQIVFYYELVPPPREHSNVLRHVRGYDAD
jgi:hypothetical protein